MRKPLCQQSEFGCLIFFGLLQLEKNNYNQMSELVMNSLVQQPYRKTTSPANSPGIGPASHQQCVLSGEKGFSAHLHQCAAESGASQNKNSKHYRENMLKCWIVVSTQYY